MKIHIYQVFIFYKNWLVCFNSLVWISNHRATTLPWSFKHRNLRSYLSGIYNVRCLLYYKTNLSDCCIFISSLARYLTATKIGNFHKKPSFGVKVYIIQQGRTFYGSFYIEQYWVLFMCLIAAILQKKAPIFWWRHT